MFGTCQFGLRVTHANYGTLLLTLHSLASAEQCPRAYRKSLPRLIKRHRKRERWVFFFVKSLGPPNTMTKEPHPAWGHGTIECSFMTYCYPMDQASPTHTMPETAVWLFHGRVYNTGSRIQWSSHNTIVYYHLLYPHTMHTSAIDPIVCICCRGRFTLMRLLALGHQR